LLGFVGPFGDSNYGDYAMFVNDVLDLNIKDMIVFSYNNLLFQRLKKEYLPNYDIEYCKVLIDYEYEERFSGVYHVDYDVKPYTPLEIIKKVKNISEVRDKIGKIKTLVVCGGGYFNHLWNANHRKSKLFSILATILLAQEQRKKIFFMGNTFGPFNESGKLFSAFFNSIKGATLSARDNLYSHSEMRQIGYSGDIKVVPDDLYLLNEKLKENEEPIYCGKYIVWECYASIDEISQHLAEIAAFSKAMNDQYGYNTVFLPLDKMYGGQIQGELIASQVPQIIFRPLTSYIKIEDLNNIVKNAEFILCHRYHLFLTSLTHNVPCVHVLKEVQKDLTYYYTKTKGLLEQVFRNQMYIESLFVHTDLWKTLEKIPSEFNEIIVAQKNLFNNKKQEAELLMQEERAEYLKLIVENS
jgi:Uncharacterized conserved protein